MSWLNDARREAKEEQEKERRERQKKSEETRKKADPFDSMVQRLLRELGEAKFGSESRFLRSPKPKYDVRRKSEDAWELTHYQGNWQAEIHVWLKETHFVVGWLGISHRDNGSFRINESRQSTSGTSEKALTNVLKQFITGEWSKNSQTIQDDFYR